jgi:hypothetical protein
LDQRFMSEPNRLDRAPGGEALLVETFHNEIEIGLIRARF